MMNKNKEAFGIFSKAISEETAFGDFRNVVGPIILNKDIIGQGENGLVLLDPKDYNRVIKIKRKLPNVDDLKEETIHHIQFIEALRVAKNRYKDLIDATIKIPQIFSGVQENVSYIRMERIYGQSIKTRFYRELYNYELSQMGYTQEELATFHDNIFELLLRFNNLYIAPSRVLFSEDFDARILIGKLKDYFLEHLHCTPLGNVLDYFEWRGLYHNDLHPGNIMIDNTGNTYIIDFGKSEFDVEKSRQASDTEKLIGHS